jgi:hypothetical protein
MDRACAEFRGWVKDLEKRIADINVEPKTADELQQKADAIAECKAEVSSTGKKRFDKVLSFMKEYPQMTFGVKKSDMEDSIRAVAGEVSKTQKRLTAALKAREEKVKDKISSKQKKAEEAVVNFKKWTQSRDDEVAEILKNLPDSLELLKKAEARVDEMRAEMRAEGRQLFDTCCALNPPGVKDELKTVVKSVVDHMKKAATILEEKVTEGIEREKNAPPAQQEEIVDEIEQESKDADGGESREDKRKAAMDRLREKKSQREANSESGSTDGDSKKEAIAALREKMLQRKGASGGGDGDDEDEISNTDRKNSLLERLKSRKKVDDGEGDADAEDKEEEDADAARERKASLLAKIKSKKKLDEEGEEGGADAGSESKDDRKAALLEKIKSRKKLNEEVESNPEEGEDEPVDDEAAAARDRKASLLEKIQSRKKLDEDESGGDGDGGGGDEKEDRKAALERLKAKKLAREESLKDAGGDGASDARAAAIERLKEKKLARDASK